LARLFLDSTSIFQGKSYMFYSCYIVVSGENQFFFLLNELPINLTIHCTKVNLQRQCHVTWQTIMLMFFSILSLETLVMESAHMHKHELYALVPYSLSTSLVAFLWIQVLEASWCIINRYLPSFRLLFRLLLSIYSSKHTRMLQKVKSFNSFLHRLVELL
jgi:hypothetical protein